MVVPGETRRGEDIDQSSRETVLISTRKGFEIGIANKLCLIDEKDICATGPSRLVLDLPRS